MGVTRAAQPYPPAITCTARRSSSCRARRSGASSPWRMARLAADTAAGSSAASACGGGVRLAGQGLARHDAVHQAGAASLDRRQPTAREQHLQRGASSQDAGQRLAAAGGGRHAQRRLRHGEAGVVRRDAQVAQAGHLDAGADDVAVERGDDGLVDGEEEAPYVALPPDGAGDGLGWRGAELGQVRAGAEGALPCPAQHHGADVGVVADRLQQRVQLVPHGDVVGVEAAGPVQRQVRHGAPLGIEDGVLLGCHRSSLSVTPATTIVIPAQLSSFPRAGPIVIPANAGTQGRRRSVRLSSFPRAQSSFPRTREPRGGGDCRHSRATALTVIREPRHCPHCHSGTAPPPSLSFGNRVTALTVIPIPSPVIPSVVEESKAVALLRRSPCQVVPFPGQVLPFGNRATALTVIPSVVEESKAVALLRRSPCQVVPFPGQVLPFGNRATALTVIPA